VCKSVEKNDSHYIAAIEKNPYTGFQTIFNTWLHRVPLRRHRGIQEKYNDTKVEGVLSQYRWGVQLSTPPLPIVIGPSPQRRG
jgi:hypothetical protein